MSRTPLIERALQLAAEGHPTEAIVKKMTREGYAEVRIHLQGRAISDQLVTARRQMARARAGSG